MFCNKCGSKIPDESVFCPNCGVKLEIIEKDTVSDPVCSSCGEKLIPGNKFCIKCGNPVMSNSKQEFKSEFKQGVQLMDEAERLYQLALNLYRESKLEEFCLAISDIIQRYPNHAASAYADKAQFFCKNDKERIIHYTAAITIDPNNKRVISWYKSRGQIYLRNDKNKEAVNDFKKILQLKPSEEARQDLINAKLKRW